MKNKKKIFWNPCGKFFFSNYDLEKTKIAYIPEYSIMLNENNWFLLF